MYAATSDEDFLDVLTTMTVSSSQLSCTNIIILDDDIVEGCEAFFIAFEVDPNFSGVATIPKEVDKLVIVIMDDPTDSKLFWKLQKRHCVDVDLPCNYYRNVTCMGCIHAT